MDPVALAWAFAVLSFVGYLAMVRTCERLDRR
jgi:hypothetical protein